MLSDEQTGKKDGVPILTYILRIIILSHAVFVGGLMANLYDY
jgi:hypothetical protein